MFLSISHHNNILSTKGRFDFESSSFIALNYCTVFLFMAETVKNAKIWTHIGSVVLEARIWW